MVHPPPHFSHRRQNAAWRHNASPLVHFESYKVSGLSLYDSNFGTTSLAHEFTAEKRYTYFLSVGLVLSCASPLKRDLHAMRRLALLWPSGLSASGTLVTARARESFTPQYVRTPSRAHRSNMFE